MKIIYDPETGDFSRLVLQPIQLPRITLVSDFVMAIEKNMYLYLSGDRKYLATRIEVVNMISSGANITTQTGDTAVIRPNWLRRRGSLPTELSFDLKFEPEDDQDLWLLIGLHDDSAAMFATDKDIRGAENIYMTGFNNTFPSGRLCTGRAPVPSASEVSTLGMSAWLNKWIEVWSQSPFNGDLVRDFHGSTLAFDPDTLTNIKIGQAWRSIYPHVEDISETKEMIDALTAVSKYRS